MNPIYYWVFTEWINDNPIRGVDHLSLLIVILLVGVIAIGIGAYIYEKLKSSLLLSAI